MSDPPDSPPCRPPRRRPRRWRTVTKAWGGYLLLLATLGGFALVVDGHRRREQAGWDAVRKQLYELKGSIDTARRPTYAQIVARFAPDRPPATRPHSEGTAFRATFDGRSFGPAYDGWSVEMTFLNHPAASHASDAFMRGRLAHGQLLYLSARPPRVYRSMPPPIWHHVQTGRRVAIAIAAIACVAAAVLTTVAGAWRPAVAQVCVGAALLAAAAWLLDPAYDWYRWADDRGLQVIAVGLAVGLLGVVLPLRRRQIDRSRCRACKYDLTGNESGVCPECGTPTRAYIDGQRHAASARIARPLESGQLECEPQLDDLVFLDERQRVFGADGKDARADGPGDDDDDAGDARSRAGRGGPPPNSEAEAAGEPIGLRLSAPRSP